MRLLSLLLCCLFFTACKPFANSREEIGKEFTTDSLNEITKAMGVKLPASVERISFYSTGGRDPGMFAKLVLPNMTVKELKSLNPNLNNWTVRDKPFSAEPSRAWWKPENLDGAAHLKNYSGDYQNCNDITWGFEDDVLVIYMSWFTI